LSCSFNLRYLHICSLFAMAVCHAPSPLPLPSVSQLAPERVVSIMRIVFRACFKLFLRFIIFLCQVSLAQLVAFSATAATATMTELPPLRAPQTGQIQRTFQVMRCHNSPGPHPSPSLLPPPLLRHHRNSLLTPCPFHLFRCRSPAVGFPHQDRHPRPRLQPRVERFWREKR